MWTSTAVSAGKIAVLDVLDEFLGKNLALPI